MKRVKRALINTNRALTYVEKAKSCDKRASIHATRACVKRALVNIKRALIYVKSYGVATISRLLKIIGLFCRV